MNMKSAYRKRVIKINVQMQIVLGISLLLYCGMGGALAQTEPDDISVESATWRLELDNDVLFGKDNKVSSGWALQKHSAVAKSWDELQGVPSFAECIGQSIPTLTKKGLVYRVGIAIGQVIQTPNDLSRSDLIEDDVPYAGALTLQSSWYAFNNAEFRGFEIIVGVVGPFSLAEQTQKILHNLVDNTEPKGWDNQLSNEPVINCTYMRKKKIWRTGNPAGISFDTSINGDVGLGNMFTQAGATLEMRLGHNMPGGFISLPDPIGWGMNYKATLKPPHPESASFYVSLALRGNAFARNIFLDGNTFCDSHSVDKEPLVGGVIGGLHFEQRHWGIHFYMMASTEDVNTSTAPAGKGREELVSMRFEWRF